jgi:hypothetical protein
MNPFTVAGKFKNVHAWNSNTGGGGDSGKKSAVLHKKKSFQWHMLLPFFQIYILHDYKINAWISFQLKIRLQNINYYIIVGRLLILKPHGLK